MVMGSHIENRRLFEIATGRVRVEESEPEHLHVCEVCQGVLYVFLNQPPASIPAASTDAA